MNSNFEYLNDDGVALQGYCERHAQENQKWARADQFAHHEWVQVADDSEVFCHWCFRRRRDAQETRPIGLYRPLIWVYTHNFAVAERLGDAL